ncbi:MAG: c-type cytochrome [Paracoccaceae bacterium]|nr:c-type cytochrome [Paracoccaceae bacterium]
MGKVIKIFITLAIVASNVVAAGDSVKGQKAFKKCKSCHMIMDESGKTIIKGSRAGPNLYGILGRKAGSIDDYKYGKSLATLGATGFVWTEAEFVTYVADPKKFLVNKLDDKKARSKMSFKLKKEADARNIWAYLVSVSE